jgi:uncharacterized protein YegJ (DUF2314 family)
MRRIDLAILAAVAAFVTIGCQDRNAYSQVDADDSAMNAAIAEARSRTAEFVEALRQPKPTHQAFGVKNPYPTPTGGPEHRWIAEVSEKDGVFSGVIAKDAFETREVALGQKVEFKLSEISDWKFQDGAKLVGGFTIRYFYDQMNPAEKEAFRKDSGLTIE